MARGGKLWAQPLTLLTDGLCHFLSCSSSGGEELVQGNHALLCSENPVCRAPQQLGWGLQVDEVRVPHGVVLLLCPCSGKPPIGEGRGTVAERGLGQLCPPTYPSPSAHRAGSGAQAWEGTAVSQ